MSRESAGAALRALRESRDWSLADLAAATGVSMMGLSYLERGARKPHKSTISKVENGLGLPPGTYAQLVMADDPTAELAHLVAAAPVPETQQADTDSPAATVTVDRHGDTEVLERYAEAQLEALNAVIDRLPASTSNEYEAYIRSVITQCVKAEMLAASSWRVAVNAGAEPAGPMLTHLRALESIRTQLLQRLPESLATRFDRACSSAGLPETVVATLLGLSAAQLWEIRAGGVVPPAALARVRAFTRAFSEASGSEPDGVD